MAASHDTADTGNSDEHIPFSRNLYGKNDDEIKFRVPFELRQKVQALAHSLGTTESDFMRELTFIRVEGLIHVLNVAEARARAVAGPVLERGANVPRQGAE